MGSAADLRSLVNDLKSAACDEQIHILQMLGGKLINNYRIEAFGVTVEPLWVEAYYYDEARFPDHNTHRSGKQKNRFGQLYFPRRGYGGVDICLSDAEDFCLSFLLKATLADGHFLTQTQLLHILLDTGHTKADFERLDDILVLADACHTVCHDPRECGQALLPRCAADLVCARRASPIQLSIRPKEPPGERADISFGLQGRTSRLYPAGM